MKAILKTRLFPTLGTPLIAGTILTILAPLGTGALPLGFRAVYWMGLTLAGGLGAMAGQALLARLTQTLPTALKSCVMATTATLAVAPFVLFLNNEFSLIGVVLTLFYIWIIAMVITVVAQMAAQRSTQNHQETSQRPALIDRLPIGMRDATLYAVTSEDHYVRIHTSSGDHMVLMRLSDVEALAQPLKGLSPHRSWWVAEQGVAAVTRKDGKMLIQLKDDTEVPVSRSGAARVKDAGWLS